MAQKPVANPGAFSRAFDQAGDIGQHEFAVLVVDHAQLRGQRREGIVTDLGLGVGDLVDKGALAGIGQADQPGISQ